MSEEQKQTEVHQSVLASVLNVLEHIVGGVRHLVDTVPQARPLQNAAEMALKHLEDAKATMFPPPSPQPMPDETDETTTAPDASETVEIPPGHDAEIDALRAHSDARGLKYSNRWRAARLREALGLGPDDPVQIAPAQLPEDKRDQVMQEVAASDNMADELNRRELAEIEAEHGRPPPGQG